MSRFVPANRYLRIKSAGKAGSRRYGYRTYQIRRETIGPSRATVNRQFRQRDCIKDSLQILVKIRRLSKSAARMRQAIALTVSHVA